MRSAWIQIAYMLIMLAAVALCAWTYRRQKVNSTLDPDTKIAIGIAAFLGAILGARLPFIFEQGWQGIASGYFWFADGKTILGGIFGGYVAVEISKWMFGIKESTGDNFVMPIAVAIIVGRIGCYVGGCCFGVPTDLPWGVHFASVDADSNILRHPTQLYEVAFHAISACLFYFLAKLDILKHQRLKVYLLAYLTYRFMTEWIRPEAKVISGFTAYQFACLLLAIVLLALWYRDARRLAAA